MLKKVNLPKKALKAYLFTQKSTQKRSQKSIFPQKSKKKKIITQKSTSKKLLFIELLKKGEKRCFKSLLKKVL